MYDLLIRGGTVCDGTGKEEYQADVAVRDGKICAVGQLQEAEAVRVLDASGRLVTPGFIDMHSHADCSVPMWPDMENLLGQGITTCFAGHCGFSIVPVSQYWLEMDFEQAAMNQMLPEFCGGPVPDPQRAVRTESFAPVFEETYGEKLDWGDFKSYIRHLQREGIGCNMSFQIGHSQLRQEAMGMEFNRTATEEELAAMEAMLEEAMKDGAWGLSIGLDYRPSTYADEKELLPLMKIVGMYGGVVTAHVQLRKMRAGKLVEGHQAMDGYREFLELGLKAGVHVHISHLMNGYEAAPGHPEQSRENAGKTIALIREYQEKGLTVTWDTLPYATVAMFHYPQLANYLRPYVDRCGGIHRFAKALKQTNYKEQVAEEIRAGKHASVSVFSKIDPVSHPDWDKKIRVEVCEEASFCHKTIRELSEEQKTDSVEMLLRILEADPETLVSRERRFDADTTAVFEQEEDVTFGTDNGCINYGVVYREKPDYPYYASTPSAFCSMIR